jgi:hypothetical protein
MLPLSELVLQKFSDGHSAHTIASCWASLPLMKDIYKFDSIIFVLHCSISPNSFILGTHQAAPLKN